MQGTKTGGRSAGTPNKVTKELRERLKTILASELDTLPDTLATLPAADRLALLVKLMPYCMPKVESIGGSYDSNVLEFDWN
jgi:hypothetical protein